MFPKLPFPGTRGHWVAGRGEEKGFLHCSVSGLPANTEGINPTQEEDRGDGEGGQNGTVSFPTAAVTNDHRPVG